MQRVSDCGGCAHGYGGSEGVGACLWSGPNWHLTQGRAHIMLLPLIPDINILEFGRYGSKENGRDAQANVQ
jgi:hypothetical protein